ncbi:recombinase family protein [Acinetobacter lactucae]|uniref:recombinase family protein n=1 Tax=Acinetobacter lactucae TaxID=1785128 RepID=UPI00358DCD18
MRVYAYIRIEPNEKQDIQFYKSYFNDCTYPIQEHRITFEEINITTPLIYRTRLLTLINYTLEKNDILVVKSIDCLGSNYSEILTIFAKLDKKQIKFICMDYSKSLIDGDLKLFFIHFIKICYDFEKKLNSGKIYKNRIGRVGKVGRPELLDLEQKNKVIEMYKQGFSVYFIAKEFSVTRTVINRILKLLTTE